MCVRNEEASPAEVSLYASNFVAESGYEMPSLLASFAPRRVVLAPGAEASFATMVESARRRGECAIGYQQAALARDSSAAYGMTMNPPKSARFEVNPEDRLIVLAED